MTRLVLKTLNFPGLILLTAAALAVQSALFSPWPLRYLQPDAVAILCIWCAFRRNFTEGGILTLISGEMAEIHSSATQGVHLMGYMLVYVSVRAADRLFVLRTLKSYVIVSILAIFGLKLFNMLVGNMLGMPANPTKFALPLAMLRSIVQGGLGFWIYRWLEKLDHFTYRSAEAGRADDDELLLDGDAF
ncbi:MAG: rod shape-determining protein MreD [Bdellovibrionota bacterium]